MTGGMKVFARVLVWAGVTTSDMAACQAQAQVRPGSLTNLVASLAFAGRERLQLIVGLRVGGEMFAGCDDRRGAGVAPA
jgi:hypothetical protein